MMHKGTIAEVCIRRAPLISPQRVDLSGTLSLSLTQLMLTLQMNLIVQCQWVEYGKTCNIKALSAENALNSPQGRRGRIRENSKGCKLQSLLNSRGFLTINLYIYTNLCIYIYIYISANITYFYLPTALYKTNILPEK